VLTVIFGMWAGDTMAYFTGKLFGSTPMAPKLSPKKTWEGFAGGAVIAVVGSLGDLFESLVKRDLQIKDSGRGIPGHGGVLDRFDALMWASVAAYFLLTVVLKF
jgi:phosphatidate cytidylyltransferase